MKIILQTKKRANGDLRVKLEKVIYEPVLLEQEFRNFDFSSPWQGKEGLKLPGDEKATK